MLDINKLLNEDRRKPKSKNQTSTSHIEARTEIERDYDRILFSTPVRRMADKTQVFPLEKNDSVRTRLTHSYEVSNLARSIGTALIFSYPSPFPVQDRTKRNIPALLAAIGLAHDLGNPPFGHKGEKAISSWFESRKNSVLDGLTEQQKNDFLHFEGNAQTFRLATRLQILSDDYGLNLTYATLAALIKYPVPSNKTCNITGDGKTSANKKHNFFSSENEIVADVWEKTGLREGVRHPLTYIMEACDDIAYSILDAEDTVKKGIASFSDLLEWLASENDSLTSTIVDHAYEKHKEFKRFDLNPSELNDISMQMLRVASIAEMIRSTTEAYRENHDKIISESFKEDLISVSSASKLCSRLKSFDFRYAYQNKLVLQCELDGHRAISDLMNWMWYAITDNENIKTSQSKRNDPLAQFVYTKISENYKRVFEVGLTDDNLRLKQCQLLTDMISGMTDSFAIELRDNLKPYFTQ